MNVLEAARRESMLSHVELWVRFFGLGGTASAAELDAYLSGEVEPTKAEYNTVVHALNEFYSDQGMNHPVPYMNG